MFVFLGWIKRLLRFVDDSCSRHPRSQRSGANWVLSTVMVQQWVEDEVEGRVFSVDMLILSVAFSTSTSIAGYLMEYTDLAFNEASCCFQA